MKRLLLLITLTLPLTSFADNCNLRAFKWECDMPVKITASKAYSNITYCGNTYVYLNKQQRNILNEYRRANINVVLKVNDQYIDDPCS